MQIYHLVSVTIVGILGANQPANCLVPVKFAATKAGGSRITQLSSNSFLSLLYNLPL